LIIHFDKKKDKNNAANEHFDTNCPLKNANYFDFRETKPTLHARHKDQND